MAKSANMGYVGLYTDESPGLKVDPFVVMVLSIGFIISVVALHSESNRWDASAMDPY
jgi:preprotein translocase subunit Sec61beta